MSQDLGTQETTSVRADFLVVDAVLRNRSPAVEFPANREKNRDFVRKWVPAPDFIVDSVFITVGCWAIP
jgi:hypothetical protein